MATQQEVRRIALALPDPVDREDRFACSVLDLERSTATGR